MELLLQVSHCSFTVEQFTSIGFSGSNHNGFFKLLTATNIFT